MFLGGTRGSKDSGDDSKLQELAAKELQAGSIPQRWLVQDYNRMLNGKERCKELLLRWGLKYL